MVFRFKISQEYVNIINTSMTMQTIFKGQFNLEIYIA